MTMSNIMIVRLVNSHEFICDLLEETSDKLVVDKPMAFDVIPDGKDSTRINIPMGPYVPLGEDEKFEINKAVVVMTYRPAKQLENKYRTYFSGIIIPTGPVPNIVKS